MIKSMTAYAREEFKQDYGVIYWELRSVNHRYLEPFIRLPENFKSMESGVREQLKNYLYRGKLECVFGINHGEGQVTKSQVSEVALEELADLCNTVSREFSHLGDITALDVLKWPGVLDTPTPDTKLIMQDAIELLKLALVDMVATRSREGEKLADVLDERLIAMQKIVVETRNRMPGILEAVRLRLRERFEELNVQLDNDRVEQEMLMLTQKTDVEEELKRLEMHIDEVKRILVDQSDKPVGRRLDFLMQELNREANTLCSKSMDNESTKAGIDLKVFIEQMREQVQNIE